MCVCVCVFCFLAGGLLLFFAFLFSPSNTLGRPFPFQLLLALNGRNTRALEMMQK